MSPFGVNRAGKCAQPPSAGGPAIYAVGLRQRIHIWRQALYIVPNDLDIDLFIYTYIMTSFIM